MPIRFRCYNCQQLLGIARRKAGTQVNCPTCQRSLTVPAEDQPDDALLPAGEPVPAPAPAQMPGLFERDDFEAMLRPPPSMAVEAPPRFNAGLAGAAPARPAPAQDYSAQGPSWQAGNSAAETPAGMVLSPARATILTVVVILLLAVSFGAGLLVGRFYL